MPEAEPSMPGEFLRVRTNGISLHVALAGPGDGAPVVLLHGFPEFWYGWRRQVAALAAGGFWILRRVLRKTARPGSFTGEDLWHYRAAWAQPGALTGGLNWYRALRLASEVPAPGRIRVPVRVIWGDRDAFLDRG